MPRKTSVKKIREELDSNFNKACRALLRFSDASEKKLHAIADEWSHRRADLQKTIVARDEFIRSQFQRTK